MKVCYGTYPWAFQKPGGGEIQLLKYQQYLGNSESIEISLYDMWQPNLAGADILHFFSCMEGSISFTRQVVNSGLPVIISPNLWITHATKDQYPVQEITAQFELASRIVCNSNAECDLLSDVFSISREKFVTVYNGVDKRFFEYVSPEEFRTEFKIHEPFILNVGNIEKRKNQLKLLEAAGGLDLKVVSIGNIRDADYMQKCAATGGDRFIQLPYLPQDSRLLWSAYKACELFALPSTLETPGIAALEAAAAGAKLLITKEGSTSEYFSDLATYVNPHDVNDISKGIEASIKSDFSLKLQKRVLEKFTWEAVTDRLSEVYLNRDVLEDDLFCAGFHLSEFDARSRYIWSKYNAELICKRNGVLVYEWEALQDSLVDISINGNKLYVGLKVSCQTEFQAVDIPQLNDIEKAIISFHVYPQKKLEIKSDPRELGLMFRDVRVIDKFATNTSLSLGDKFNINFSEINSDVLFEHLNIGSHGFHKASSSDILGLHVWSKLNARLFIKRPGLLTFDWKTLQGSVVNVSVNEEIKFKKFLVGCEPTFQSIIIPENPGAQCTVVEFIVEEAECRDDRADPRELGLMFSDVRFYEKNHAIRRGTDNSECDVVYDCSDVIFEEFDIDSVGFNKATSDLMGRHIWSKFHSQLIFPGDGEFLFEWRGLSKVLIEVFCNGEKFIEREHDDQDWSEQNWPLRSLDKNVKPIIDIRITLLEEREVTADPRELGMAFRKVRFTRDN